MASNLFIAYDLLPPGQNYPAVHEAIRSLGKWHQFQYSFWYVHTEYSPEEAFAIVLASMDARGRGFRIRRRLQHTPQDFIALLIVNLLFGILHGNSLC